MTEKLDVRTLQGTDEGKLALHAALLTLEGLPAWDVVVQFLDAQADATLKLMAVNYDKPAEVARLAGRHEALRFLEELPTKLKLFALQIMDGRRLEEELAKEEAGARTRFRANTAGEVSG
jgi:hypothetical protein